uniref:PsiF repeat-containing protein n=1 Tax=Bosea sp. NBC_00436 TaxID=2969620 RepID=A0A9E7ZMC0_9HYPH
MMKLFSALAVAGLMMTAMTATSQAQESKVFRKMTAGQPAPLHGSMTQAQARKQCRMELGGSRESKRSINIKMRQCMDKKMNGTM